MLDASWWADRAPRAADRASDPLDAGELWTLHRDGHTAAAGIRLVSDLGIELVYRYDSSIVHTRLFREDADQLQAVAEEKRQELEARGWTDMVVARAPDDRAARLPVTPESAGDGLASLPPPSMPTPFSRPGAVDDKGGPALRIVGRNSAR